MSNILDLLKLPSMEYSYIIAGLNGAYNIVKKISILETPFPQVEEFLKPNEFTFTSFWNSKDNKENRVNLVKSMIEHKCSGIGIMPSSNLNDEIDEDIVNLGNSYSFPVIYIPSHVRWSDIISEFSLLANASVKLNLDSNILDILNLFSDLHIEKNLNKFCSQLNQFLSIPIIINTDNIYFSGIDVKKASLILSKIYSIKMQNLYKTNIPLTISVNNQNVSIVIYGENSILATYANTQNITNPSFQMFNKIAPFIIRELNNMNKKKNEQVHQNRICLNKDESYYFALLKKDSITSVHQYLDPNYIIYEESEFYNYIIILISANSDEKINIYNKYYKIIEKTYPLLFVFSNQSCSAKELYDQIKMLKYTISSLLFLNGIFTIDELPLLNMVLYAPYEFKEAVFRANSIGIDIEVEQSFFDTLRLYLVLRNINSVSTLLGIHSNSVKYRISKCLKIFESDPHNMLSDLPNIKFLLLLEILKVEDILMFTEQNKGKL